MRILLIHWRRQSHVPDSSLRAPDTMLLAVSAWLAGFQQKLGERLFTIQDAQARLHGWQIAPIKGGLGRRYRDPRFDPLARCPACKGSGRQQDTPCHACSGSGRVVARHPHEEG
jgi:hypothetical protein